MSKFVIINGNFMSMEKEGLIDDQVLCISDGKIQGFKSIGQVDKDYEVVDAQGGFVLPGFIDSHTHAGIFGRGGDMNNDGNEYSSPITPELRGIDGINFKDLEFQKSYENGITTIATGPGSANPIAGQFALMKTFGKTLDDMVICPYHSMKMAFGENPKRVYGSKNKAPVTRMAITALIRENLHKAKAYAKNKRDAKVPPAYDIQLEALEKVLTRAVKVKAHAHRADDILTAIRIKEEFNLDLSIEHCTEGHLVAEAIAQSKTPVVLGPILSYQSKTELINRQCENAAILHKAGVKFAISTDLPATPNEFLPLAAGVCMKYGLDEWAALKAITINAAEILGIDHRLGSLSPGKDADVIIFKGHPLKEVTSRCQWTMVNGQVVYRG